MKLKTSAQNWIHAFVLCCLIGVCLSESIRAYEVEVVSGRAMGTSYTLKFNRSGMHSSVEQISEIVASELEKIESTFSLYRPDSELSQWNAAAAGEWIPVSKELYFVAKYAVELSQLTDGAFDPTLRPLIELWQSDSLSGSWKPPSPEAIRAQMKKVGASQILFQVDPIAIQKKTPVVRLDLNALVEGWAIDKILELLKSNGCSNAVFELGGEQAAIGCKPDGQSWIVGIEDPQALSRVYATVSLSDAALCTSGSYRQSHSYAGKYYSHIIDPRTGSPIEHDLLSVSVVHSNAMVADGWATALMVLGPTEGEKLAATYQLAASFVQRSVGETKPKLSTAAHGRIITAEPHTPSRIRELFIACGVVVVSCFAIAILVQQRRK